MNKKNLITGAALLMGVVALIIAVYQLVSSPKIAYVRSQELINDFMGMKEASNIYQEKTKIWQANVDTLELEFQKAVSNYRLQSPTLSNLERKNREQELNSQQQNVMQYSESIKKKAQEEDEKMTQGVLNQINGYIEEYGKRHGYDLIMGTTLSGNVLYGNKAIDITEEVLEGLNKNYKNEGVKK